MKLELASPESISIYLKGYAHQKFDFQSKQEDLGFLSGYFL